ncbi:MAG: hypothetical protein GYB64_18015, partial [Chloroflexi bacterium]|nr:hypothetical protein [Chloroflexota bacterium]
MDNHDNEERDDRLDRLLRAQEEAGLPGIDEPPIKEGDTPTGGHTPPKGIDAEELRRALGRWDAESTAMEADDDEPPTIPMEPAYPRQPAEDDAPIKEDKPQASRQPPAFLHPTDPVPQQPQAPAEPDEDDLPFNIQPSEAGWEDSTGAQTPGPDVTDAEPPSGVRVDESGMPLPRHVPNDDPDPTNAAPSAFREPPETPIDETVPRGYKRPDQQHPQPASRAPPAPPPPPSSRAARAAELSPGPSVPPVSGPAPARAATVQGG